MELNQMINADCMEFMKGIESGVVDLTLTDIPYDGLNQVNEHGGATPALRKLKKGTADTITFDLVNFLDEVNRVTKGTIIIFCGISQVSKIFDYFFEMQTNNKGTVRQLVWHKTNPSPMNGDFIYLSSIENAVWFRKSQGTFNGHCKHNLFEYPTGQSKMHPTEKNHDLLAELINDNSNVGDLIFDPCSGSGSTLLVANNLRRKFIGCEKDKSYFTKAKMRLDAEMAQMTIFDFLGDNNA